jgi:hypothetical protein
MTHSITNCIDEGFRLINVALSCVKGFIDLGMDIFLVLILFKAN